MGGGYTLVATTLFLLREALKDSDNGRFTLLSGVCYPLKPLSVIETFFKDNPYNYISYVASESNHKYWVERYYFYDTPYFDARTRVNSLKNNIIYQLLLIVQRITCLLVQGLHLRIRPKTGMKYYHGSQWFSLTREAVQRIIDKLDANPKIEKRFRYTAVIDESFFIMMLLNDDALRPSVVNDDLRLRNADGRLFRGGPARTAKDYDFIKASTALWGRKLIPGDSDELMDRIDREILNPH